MSNPPSPYGALPHPEDRHAGSAHPTAGYPPSAGYPSGTSYPSGAGYPSNARYPPGEPHLGVSSPDGPLLRNTRWVIPGAGLLIAAVLGFGVLTHPRTPTAPTISSTPPASTCDEHAAGPGPQTPAGWSTVTTPRGLVYDVPPEWEVLSCSTLVGWEKPCDDGPFGFCPIRTMSGAAKLRNDGCESGSRALTGAPGSRDIDDIDTAVRRESTKVADIFTSTDGVAPDVSLSKPRRFTIGDTPAVEVVATVTGVGPGKCTTSPGRLHAMVATTMPDQPGTVLFVVSMNQGDAGDPDPGLAEQIVGTLRHADRAAP